MEQTKTKLFGKVFNVVGNTDSNILIKTKGDLKIQWGNKFIDLIKEGKITSTLDIKEVNNKDSVGNKGIYIVKEDNSLWINGKEIEFNNSSNFLSYKDEQKLNLEQQILALKNLGIYFNTLEELNNSNSTMKIVFVEDQNNFYIFNNNNYIPYNNSGQLSVFWYEGN